MYCAMIVENVPSHMTKLYTYMLSMCMDMCVYIHIVHVYMYIYIFIVHVWSADKKVCVHIYIYIYIACGCMYSACIMCCQQSANADDEGKRTHACMHTRTRILYTYMHAYIRTNKKVCFF